MRTHAGHLTYCTNIHAGESWMDHFASLRAHFPAIKARIAPDRPMGIGLRLSNQASLDLVQNDQLALFKQWLTENQAYVFTMNGFPYGGFHHTRVKDQVHAPDWTTGDRVAYTLRLFGILAELMPEGKGVASGAGDGDLSGFGSPDDAFPPDAGISTSPLSYRHWFTSPDQLQEARAIATRHIVSVAEQLVRIHRSSGKLLHLDIEPEPDGLLETGAEFIEWFEADLLPAGRILLASTFSCTGAEAESLLKEHIRLCYDVCHFAIGYEPHREVMRELAEKGIKIGKIQISAALKAMIPAAGAGGAGGDPGSGVMEGNPAVGTDSRRAGIRQGFAACNEPVYLHQVVAKQADGSLLRYPDLPEALADFDRPTVQEWRAHFHVPIFLSDFGSLQSTREDISEVLALQQERSVTQHLEVETYTWEVLPDEMRLPLEESIIRELQWVKDELTTTNE
jgi:hypothetical protein